MNHSSSSPATSSKTPILLLKTKSVPNDGYEELFLSSRDETGELSFEPTFVPVLEHKFLDSGLDVVRGLLKGREFGVGEDKDYGGLIFTSQRAVEAFARLVEEGKGDKAWPHLENVPIYTVGPATSRALHSIPSVPALSIFGSQTGNGEALAHYMLEHYPSIYPNQRPLPKVLFLVGEQRRDIIPKTLMDDRLGEGRIGVDELVVYGTGVMESFEGDFGRILRELDGKRGGKMRWVVVFSPTGCEAMLRALGVLDPITGRVGAGAGNGDVRTEGLGEAKQTFIATIGPTTRDYLRDTFGFIPHVCAEKPSPEGVEAGIRTFMKNR